MGRNPEGGSVRLRAKVDSNHGEIVAAFKAMGVAVQSLAQMGGGVPDLLVAVGGVTWLIEVKAGKGTETDAQKKFAEAWTGCRAIVRDVEGVETVVKTMRQQATRLAAFANTRRV